MLRRTLLVACALASIALTAWVFSRRLRHSEVIALAFVAIAAGFLVLLGFFMLSRRTTIGWGLTVFSVAGFPITFALVLLLLFHLERSWW